MAKVKGPLMSMEASGQYGGTLVFDPRGYVRQLVTPTNPKTGSQGDARQKLAAVQAVLKIAGAVAIAAMKAVATIGYRWNAYILQQAIGPNAQAIDAALVAFNALDPGDQATWNSAFADALVPDIDYSTMDTPTSGGAAWAVCQALFDTGAITSPGTPSSSNSAAWHAAVVA